MFIERYQNNRDFINATKYVCPLLKSSFVRGSRGVQPICVEWTLTTRNSIFSKTNLQEIKKAAPLLGTILGLGRLYSVWSTKDRTTSKKELLLHTLTGIVETLGLGIILLIAKITLTAIKTIRKKINLYCCYGSRRLPSNLFARSDSASDDESSSDSDSEIVTSAVPLLQSSIIGQNNLLLWLLHRNKQRETVTTRQNLTF